MLQSNTILTRVGKCDAYSMSQTSMHPHDTTHTHTHTCTRSRQVKLDDRELCGPKTESHEYSTPVEEAPTGMISRGHYTMKSKFTDDDKTPILEWEWSLDFKKDWGA